ncbi:MAG: hypothetical protein JNK14_11490 [Chitinophagaceae bacterium]|nr:hypothetical protein [Chitinophagaceae bacterium]
MKQLRCNGLLFCAALVFILSSCGESGSGEKNGADTNTNATTGTEPVTPPSTIVTTPENMAIIIHKVADYDKWIVAYEAHDSARLANGLHNYVIGRGMQDPNMVMVALKADDITKAKSFSKDPGLKAAMQKAGVTGQPSVSFVNATWQDTANIGSVPRSMTTFTIKDWDNWQKNFADGKQERMDNGITDRVVGHEADDNKKVVLVTAVMDTTKAFAYYKSDMLKKRREAGGLTSEPKRFLFYVAKRY